MMYQMHFDFFLGIPLGLLLEFKPAPKSSVKKCFAFESQKHTRVPGLLSSLCQMLYPVK